ncbi:MAG: hypothetical protein ACFFAS_00155 [Promethearchaeota archaeon]
MLIIIKKDNQITTIPESMLRIKSLKGLHISEEWLDSRSMEILKQLKKKGVIVGLNTQ